MRLPVVRVVPFVRVAPLVVGLLMVACGDGTIGEPVARDEAPIRGGRPATSYPEAALVDLYRGGVLQGVCSGAVVAPRAVLTAGHCVTGADGWEVTAPFAQQQSASASMAATRYVEAGERVNPSAPDLGLIFLDTPIVLDRYPTLAARPLADGSLVVDLGRIRGGQATSTLYVSKAFEVEGGAPYGYPYHYLASQVVIEPGDSGGPVMTRGSHRIVAVNSGAGDGSQVLARVDLEHDWLRASIRALGAGSGAPTSCGHHPCAEGAPLEAGCDPCVDAVCAADAYCCRSQWDETCTRELAATCQDRCG